MTSEQQKVREAKRIYQREYFKAHPDKHAKSMARYWIRKAMSYGLTLADIERSLYNI